MGPPRADPLTRLPAAVRADWEALAGATPSPAAFDPATVEHLPEPARRWLRHAIAPGTPLRTRVVLDQHGRIRIGRWRPFRARQVIAAGDGYLWACATRVAGLPVYGYDRLAHGRGDMAHRILGRVAIVDESGPDLTRSAFGRLVSEMVWVPTAALGPAIEWEPVDDDTVRARVPAGEEAIEVDLTIGPSGAVRSVRLLRWASVDRGPYQLHPFGADVDGEATFDGVTGPTRVTVGYGDGSPEWPAGAFIELEVDRARFL